MKLTKLTPNFSVKNVKDTILFYRDILGFKLEMVVPKNKNIIEYNLADSETYSYAMMSKDEVFIMFIEENCFKKDIPLFKNTPQGASLLFYIDAEDIGTIYDSIKEKVEIVKDLETTWYGKKEFYIKDCNGYVLGFGENEQSVQTGSEVKCYQKQVG
ncbi:MAG: bleomycin resistance family protein [Nitrospirae bacterium]|nr:bleomycin resistance family protein [Nitrospirota bacterium]